MPELDNPAGAFRYQLLFAENRLKTGGAAGSARSVAGGAFSECTGLEATMEPRVIKEGGLNYGAHQRVGTVSFATVVLRRGMTQDTNLWSWFSQIALRGSYTHRMDVTIRHLDVDGSTVVRAWRLDRALPVKFKSSDLNARGSEVAIEELHLVHEGLKLL